MTDVAESVIPALRRGVIAERSLVRDGKEELVLNTRLAYQMTMRTDLVAGLEQLTGRTVRAFMSANHMDPDVAVEIFLLEGSKPS